MNNHFDQIRTASKLGWTKRVTQSIVDTLLQAHWCESRDMEEGLNLLETNEETEVVVFFQLPFVMRLPAEPIRLESKYARPKALFRTTGTVQNELKIGQQFEVKERESYSGYEHMCNAFLPNDTYGVLLRTQALLSFQLWEPRSQYYQDYLKSLKSEVGFKSIVVPSGKSWIENHKSASAAVYEIDLARRLHREALNAFNSFVTVYSVSCKDPHAHKLTELNSFFIMVKTGRIVVTGPAKSIIAQYAKPFKETDFSKNYSVLLKRLQSKKPATIYEEYLLEAVRQVEIGSPNLAVVYTVMILDWFANEIIQDRMLPRVKDSLKPQSSIADLVLKRLWESTRVSTRDKFKDFFPAMEIRLSEQLMTKFIKLVQLRDSIVHRIQTKPIEPMIALESIDTGFLAIQHCMHQILSAGERSISNVLKDVNSA
jgi:hypothetical protein